MRSRQFLPSRRPSVTFAVALAVAVLLAASGSAPCWAVLNDNTVKGAATHHVFSSSFGDSIDTLSGQLHFKIPIGPSFAVSDSFSYQLYLTYTSKVWRYDHTFFTGTNDPNDPVARYRLDGRAQAGVGFYLQMGRIFWKGEGGEWHLIVQLADGTEHDVTNGVAEATGTEVPTPHVQTQTKSVGPGGQVNLSGEVKTRPATKQDIRVARKLEEKKNR